ncbi:MAG: tRNA nucleotidyltransferase [Desulfovibrio sp.]
MQILLVGGAVRNLLLGRPVADKDFLVLGATRSEFLARFPQAHEVGKSFGVFLVDGLEHAFPRETAPPGANPDAVLQSDLEARDLTVNAMALDENGNLFCHPQALEDLHARVLRPARHDALEQDPLRAFRAARFLAEYPDFTAHQELRQAMERCAASGALNALAPLRICRELLKALAAPRPARFFRFLAETGCLAHWMPELERLQGVPAGPPQFHNSCDAFEHTLRVADELAGHAESCWMGVCHDLGKGATDPALWPRHIGHEKAGAPLARMLGERLFLPAALIRAGILAAELHMTAGRYPGLRPGTRVDLLMRLHAARLVESMFRLVYADQGEDHLPLARHDLAALLAVRLPENERNQGARSGERLRMLRAQALNAPPAD